MIPLDRYHPCQLVLGAVIIGEELATKNRQTTFASLCRDAVQWATETRDLLREIATDAEYLDGQIDEVAQDGKITKSEEHTLHSLAQEIRDEAVTGKIIS